MKVGTDNSTLTAEFTLLHNGEYRIKHFDTRGQLRFSPLHTFAESTTNAKLTLLSPKEDTEIREREKVRLVFESEDDFGLSKVRFHNLSSKRFKKEQHFHLQNCAICPNKKQVN